jgi:hypothetical protein
MMASDLQRSVDRGLKVNGYRRRAQEIRLGAPSDPGRADQALELCRNNMESLRSACTAGSLAANRALEERFARGDGVATNCDQATLKEQVTVRSFVCPRCGANSTRHLKKLLPPVLIPNSFGSCVEIITSPAPTLKPLRTVSEMKLTVLPRRNTQARKPITATRSYLINTFN